MSVASSTTTQALPHDAYAYFAHCYDECMGERDEIPLIMELFAEYLPTKRGKSKRVLELACGTGAILEAIATRYTVTGLDLSADMLSIARERLGSDPHLFLNSMHKFDLRATFDAIGCFFNSINHLLTFTEWKQTFASVSHHLEPGGLFIFDMNTILGLKRYFDEPPVVAETEDYVATLRYEPLPRGRISIDWDAFVAQDDGSYHRLQTSVVETAFATDRVKQALSRHFRIERVIDPERSRPHSCSEVLYFVCRKK